MNINCFICVKSVGDITKSRLLKGTKHICKDCYGTVKLWREMASKHKKEEDPMRTFNDMFGTKF